MKVRLLRHFVFAIFFLVVSCNKDDHYEDVAVQQQGSLLAKLETSVQVVNVQNSNQLIDIGFADGTHNTLSNEMTPFLSLDYSSCWVINGTSTGFKASYSDESSLLLPAMQVGESGKWIIDGKETGIKASSRVKGTNLKIRYIALSDQLLYIVFRDGRNNKVTIVSDPDLIVPSYYLEVLKDKEGKAMSTIKSLGTDCTSFVFFTDSHWGANYRHSPALIKHIVDYTDISRVFFGGDVITSYNDSQEEALAVGNSFKRAFAFLGHDLYSLFGNHDDNSTGQPNKLELHLTEEQVYSYLQEQMTDVNYWNYYNFYFDDPASKTRFLCLDTGRLYYSQFGSHSVPTVRFIVETLTSTPENWHIIVLSHYWCGLKEIDGIKECRIATAINPILKVIDDYNSRKEGVYSYASEKVSYDFRESNAIVHFCIGGHNHRDGIVYSDSGIPIIIVDTDSFKTINGEEATPRTVSEQCVSIVVADYVHNQLDIFRVGRGEDSVIQFN